MQKLSVFGKNSSLLTKGEKYFIIFSENPNLFLFFSSFFIYVRVNKSLKNNGNEKMKVVILAGGFGTRISEESYLKPKPMIAIGDAPILWHIMKWYSRFGINEFIICAGYKQDVIKEWFADYFLHFRIPLLF